MPLYHVWFATRGRKWLLQGEVAEKARQLFVEIARDKNLKLLECEAIVDHAHLMIDCATKEDLSKALFFLKGQSSRRLGILFPTIGHDAHTLHFWQKGFGSKIVAPQDVETTRRYIRTQWERLEKYERPNRLKA